MSISHPPTVISGGYGRTEAAGKTGVGLGGGGEEDRRGYPGQSQRRHGIFEEAQVAVEQKHGYVKEFGLYPESNVYSVL